VEIAMPLVSEPLDDADERAAPPLQGTGVFGDIPRTIWIAFLAAWALLFGLFIIFFTANGEAALMVVTASFFALMTLGLPAALGALSKPASRQPHRMIATRSGLLPVGAAATQILLIPVGAVIGLMAFIALAM
jgi:hypothetical protein